MAWRFTAIKRRRRCETKLGPQATVSELTTSESIYQDFLARSLTDKYSTLSSQMDKIIHDANSEILGLRDKLSGMHSSHDRI